MPTLKPLDVEAIVEHAGRTGALVTVENHLVTGGLGSAVAEVLAEHRPAPLERVGLRDTFALPGTPDHLFETYGLTADGICAKARRVLERKDA